MTQPPPPGYPPQQPPAGAPPNNNLVFAIVGFLFCFAPGIFAIIKATQVSSLWAQGQYAEAQASADAAKKWGIIGIVAGVVAWVLYIILAVVGGIMASNTTTAMIAAMV